MGQVESQRTRVGILCTALASNAPAPLAEEHARLLDAVMRCDPKGPVVAFVSKGSITFSVFRLFVVFFSFICCLFGVV
jgi:hypothetical protein